jgi:hypothetical protein
MKNNWIRALKYYTMKRLTMKCTNPVTTEKRTKDELILISGKPRFILKDGTIYGSDKHGNINKKECYDRVENWKQWDWSGYYPFKRSLYDWKKAKRQSGISRRTYIKPGKREVEIMATISKETTWPYTNTDGKSDRSIS